VGPWVWTPGAAAYQRSLGCGRREAVTRPPGWKPGRFSSAAERGRFTLPIAALGGATSSSTSQPRMSNGMSSGVNWMRQASSPSTMPMISTSLVLARPGRPIAGHDREQIAGAADTDFGLRGRNPPIRTPGPVACRASRATTERGEANGAPTVSLSLARNGEMRDFRPEARIFRSAPRTGRPRCGRLMVPENRAHGTVSCADSA
jgi:hypothetical protein